MNASLIAIVGLGAIGLFVLSSSKKDSIQQYDKIVNSPNMDDWLKEDTDLLKLSDELLNQGYQKESEEIRAIFSNIYAPHMTEEEIITQISKWKQNVTNLYGVEWQN